MAGLAPLLTDIAMALFDKAGVDIVDYIAKKRALAASQAQTDASAQASVTPLQNAATGANVDAAAKDAFDGT